MISVAFLFSLFYGVLSAAQADKTDYPTILDERDGQAYSYIQIDNLFWLRENMRLKTERSMTISDTIFTTNNCGSFYFVDEALSVCPKGWRLPTEKEVKTLIKLEKKKHINIIDTLNIKLCGRIDGKKIARVGMQTTFWIDAPLKDGNILHWHIFGNRQELHEHNVVVAKRQFPVRCVCETDS